jgi:hypothetical protein
MLLAYPYSFRRGYSHQMMLVFRDRARAVVQHAGSWALLPFMLHVSEDWFRTTLQAGTNVAVNVPALRWFAALPAAMFAAYASPRILFFFVRTDFAHIWIRVDIALFLMTAAFVSIGVWVAPSRKASVGRIALGVVAFWSALPLALGGLSMATTPISWGACGLLGGVAGYLPWRLRQRPPDGGGLSESTSRQQWQAGRS